MLTSFPHVRKQRWCHSKPSRLKMDKLMDVLKINEPVSFLQHPQAVIVCSGLSWTETAMYLLTWAVFHFSDNMPLLTSPQHPLCLLWCIPLKVKRKWTLWDQSPEAQKRAKANLHLRCTYKPESIVILHHFLFCNKLTWQWCITILGVFLQVI